MKKKISEKKQERVVCTGYLEDGQMNQVASRLQVDDFYTGDMISRIIALVLSVYKMNDVNTNVLITLTHMLYRRYRVTSVTLQSIQTYQGQATYAGGNISMASKADILGVSETVPVLVDKWLLGGESRLVIQFLLQLISLAKQAGIHRERGDC